MDSMLLLVGPFFLIPRKYLGPSGDIVLFIWLLLRTPIHEFMVTSVRKQGSGISRSKVIIQGLEIVPKTYYGIIQNWKLPNRQNIIVRPLHILALPDKGNRLDGRAKHSWFPPRSKRLFSSLVVVVVLIRWTSSFRTALHCCDLYSRHLRRNTPSLLSAGWRRCHLFLIDGYFTVTDTSTLQLSFSIEFLTVRRISESWLVGAGIPVIITHVIPRNLCRLNFLLVYNM